MTSEKLSTIDIKIDGVWAGSGKIHGDSDDGYQIVDCGAQFDDDMRASDNIYGKIEEAIETGKTKVIQDGRVITWDIEPVEELYRVIEINNREVLSLDILTSISEARAAADEIEQHESQPEVGIEKLSDGEWVAVS